MPSRADSRPRSGASIRERARMRAELVLRVVALLALTAAAIVVSGVFADGATGTSAPLVFTAGNLATRTSAPLSVMLQRTLLSANALKPIHLLAQRVPGDTTRALLAASRAIGMPVTWTDSSKGGAVALETRALIDPRGGVMLSVAAPAGTPVAFGDSLGLIDSVRVHGSGGNIVVGRLSGSSYAATSSARAAVVAPAPQVIRRILLLAEPGWEAKFVMAALEERGWNVEARFSIGKNVAVTQGTPAQPDTARYAAVVVLDSSALLHVAAIRKFAASGGGVVLAGASGTLREFGNLLPGKLGARQAGVPGGLQTSTPLVGLGFRPITPDSNAVVIARAARDANAAAIVARRFGDGRVMQVAYDGSWEWRMAGPDGSVDAHREWWSRLVAAVAFAPEVANANDVTTALSSDAPGNAAPYADTRALLGDAAAMPSAQARTESSGKWELVLMIVAVLALLGEWGSRRLRGAR